MDKQNNENKEFSDPDLEVEGEEEGAFGDEEEIQRRPDFMDFASQYRLRSAFNEIDQDGDEKIILAELPTVLALLGETKITPEKMETIMNELSVVDEDARDDHDRYVTLQNFLDKIGPFLENYGSKSEFTEAFRVLDEKGKGSIPVNTFRYYMLEYGQVEPAKLDELVMDMLEMKKNAAIDPATPLDYMDFATRIFDPVKKDKKGKKGKGKGKRKGRK